MVSADESYFALIIIESFKLGDQFFFGRCTFAVSLRWDSFRINIVAQKYGPAVFSGFQRPIAKKVQYRVGAIGSYVAGIADQGYRKQGSLGMGYFFSPIGYPFPV